MKKYNWLFICLFTLAAHAQEKLVVMGKPPDQYVIHTVNGEESLQDISNQFGQSVTKLSVYNGLNASAVMSKGTQVKIPLTEYNLVRVKGDNSAPVYHIIAKGENLYRLSKTNNVSLAALKEWNRLTTDIVKDGQPLIIGFMVNARVTGMPEIKKEEPVKKPNPDPNVAVIKERKSPVKKEPVTAPAKTISPETVTTTTPDTKPPVKKETVVSAYAPREGDEGYFATPFWQHPKEQSQQFHSGDAATFKTISGWTDRKYYILINDVAPETLVRITAPNNKSICAKVLGPLQETKGGSGLLLRMSNSAASTLGITDPKFTVTVTFFE